jgi:hypothetical protein
MRVFVAAAILALLASAAAGEPPSDPLRFTKGAWDVKLSAFGGLQPTGEYQAFWNAFQGGDPAAGYDPNRFWTEYWIFPGVTATFRSGVADTFYGGMSAGITGNLGSDIYASPPSGRAAIETMYLGWRHKDTASGFSLDLSTGQQNYSIGTGFLVYQGAQNGGTRGATNVAPRTAWEMTGIVRLAWGKVSADGFFLEYNAIPGQPTTQLAGGAARLSLGGNQVLGLAFIDAVESTMTYAQAPETVIPSGRKGTTTSHAFATFKPLPSSAPSLLLSGEGALQRNMRIDLKAWAAAGTVSWGFEKTAWKPTLSYTCAYYSGDDPSTPALEKFDPLFWNGGVTSWATGGNGAYSWTNSNIVMQRVHLNVAPSPSDVLDLLYFYISAARTNSPLGFGQAPLATISTPILIPGVPTSHLNDGLVVQWQRNLSRNWTLTSTLELSFPGAGLKAVSNGTATTWVGGDVNLAFSY